MKIILDIKLDVKDLYRFNIQKAYSGLQGMLSIIIPVFLIALTADSYGEVGIGYTILYAGLAILLLVYVPLSLWLRVRKIMKDENNALSKTIHYEFCENVIRVSVGEESVEFGWENIYLMKTAKPLLLVYTNRVNAYILPLEQVGKKYEKLSEMAHRKLEKHRIKMK